VENLEWVIRPFWEEELKRPCHAGIRDAVRAALDRGLPPAEIRRRFPQRESLTNCVVHVVIDEWLAERDGTVSERVQKRLRELGLE
jgi:hypothetical protein